MTKDNPIYGKLKNKVSENILGPKSKVELVAHGSNIPNIDFNESGRYLASASIDQTCRVWDITTQEVVTQKKSVNLNEPQHDSWQVSLKLFQDIIHLTSVNIGAGL
jgi:WD40 repeat protein